jgi:hypothetical protein
MSENSTIVRLRRANPVPETPAGDSTDLFDRITTLPQDPPTGQRPVRRPSRRRRALVLVLAGIAVLLVSTAFGISKWFDDGLVEPPVTIQEYFDAQKQLELPPGVAWPPPDVAPHDNSVTRIGAGGSRAVLIAMNEWECFWADAIRRGDANAGRRAHDELNRLLAVNVFRAPAEAPEEWVPSPLPNVPFAVFSHNGGLGSIRQSYVRAAAGDPTEIAQSCRANAR